MSQTLALPEHAMTLTVADDTSILFDQTERTPTSLNFDPARGVFDEAFAVLGHDLDGNLIHTQAVGYCQTDVSLDAYLRRRYRDYRPADYPLSELECRIDLPPSFAEPCGRFAYHGELWMRPGRDGRQGLGLARKLTNFAMIHALERWDVDLIWAVVSEKKIRTRFPERSGYLRHDGPAFRWRAGERSLEEWVVWSLAEEVPNYSNDIFCAGSGSVNTASLPSESSGTVMRL